MRWLAVAIGGAFGSVARHGVNVAVAHYMGRTAPYATAIVNIAGSLVIGALAGLIASGRLQLSVTTQTFLFVGILGGFTTFSSFMLDVLTLGIGGQSSVAFWNLVGQVGGGLIAIVAGYAVGRG